MTEPLTQDAETYFGRASVPRAFLVIHIDDDAPDASSRVVELPRDTDVTFGRSRGATIHVDTEKVSRLHAKVRRTGDGIEVEDLGSRNGTRVNGELIKGARRLASGDEISIGPIHAVVGLSSGLRTRSPVADAAATEARLAAEVDRSVRYRRPLTLALLRITDPTGGDAADIAVTAIARALRPMDLIGEDAGDDYLVLLPELERASGAAAIARLPELVREARATVRSAVACAPDDGTTVEALVGRLRAALRTGASPDAAALPAVEAQAVVVDPAMRRVYTLVDRIADTAMTVLILGETGVGKELVTEAIHKRSSRRERPLIKLNCAALPETLLESELFGYERGAFTGADRRKIGFFEAADGGTLFLDEIGEIPLPLQAKLLRVLERKVVTRVGGTTEVPTDARVIAATHRDLDAEVRAGRFRQDLMYRIGGFTIAVPPLRDRPDEILPLAEHFAKVAAAEQGRPAPAFAPDAREALTGYAWPGNVRELRNAIERALVLCGDAIHTTDLPDRLGDESQRVRPITPTSDVRGQLAEVERSAIVAALDAESQNQTRAARRLGLSRRALIYKMEKYGLKAPPKQAGS
ncbi:MAG: sigma 54-interacting transcriptional regulator [Deltaproteobacteria bacterium]|nr:sigma 54-interacting transcriptional regulator [Deltaproteobacteria bacterium]MCW5807787.1 sigma 54-interacting transcriptional regulator [Deltaproteobacteria bacterium]